MPACARREYPSNDRRLAAILAVDVVGYSRLTGGDRAQEVVFLGRGHQARNRRPASGPTPAQITETPASALMGRQALSGRNWRAFDVRTIACVRSATSWQRRQPGSRGERGEPERVYRFMSAHQAMYPIRTMTRVLKVSASGYSPTSRRAIDLIDG
jgi:hypothetical protein